MAKQNVKKELISKNVNLRKLSIKIKAGAIGMKSKKDVQRLPEEKKWDEMQWIEQERERGHVGKLNVILF